jgi:membrane protein required for colicin V production
MVVLAVVAVSAIVAFSRGVVREVLGIAAWVGAFFFASATVGMVRETVRGWIGNPDIADPAAYAGMFLLGLVVLSIVVGVVGGAVRTSFLGGVDRTLGVVFGIARGAVLVAALYVVSSWVVTADRWPPAVAQSRSLPYAYDLATWIAKFLPTEYRPSIPVPPEGHQTTAAELLHATPQGYATGKPIARP